MSKRKLNLQQKTDAAIKNAVNALIKYVSVIAVFISLGVIILLYAGPEINLTTGIVFRLAVPSVVLSISVVIVYELWVVNGRRNGFEEEDYQNLLKEYMTKSDNLDYKTAQEFLDDEYVRRYVVEEKRLQRKLQKECELLPKIEALFDKEKRKSRKERKLLVETDKEKPIKRRANLIDLFELWTCRRNIKLLTRALSTIKVTMPYEKSEEFDYLRYNMQDVVYKEYAPEDAQKHLNRRRARKYVNTFTFTLVGLNILSIGGTMGDFWSALILSALAAVTLVFTVIQGFTDGYNNIKIVSTGIYKTANSFIDQAVAYCKHTGKNLYYRGETEYRELPLPAQVIEVTATPQVQKEDDIFARVEQEVTGS